MRKLLFLIFCLAGVIPPSWSSTTRSKPFNSGEEICAWTGSKSKGIFPTETRLVSVPLYSYSIPVFLPLATVVTRIESLLAIFLSFVNEVISITAYGFSLSMLQPSSWTGAPFRNQNTPLVAGVLIVKNGDSSWFHWSSPVTDLISFSCSFL